MGEVLPLLQLKLMDKPAIAIERNHYLKIFPERIEIFLQKL